MDLLIRTTGPRRVASALSTVLLTAACAGAPGDPAATDQPTPTPTPTRSPADPDLSALLASAGEIEPVHRHEQVVARATGPGADPVVFTGTSDRFVTVYVRCLAAEPDTDAVIDVSLRRVDDVLVPCDGIISRSDVFTEPATPVEVSISGPPGIVWTTLVTTRSRNLPRSGGESDDG